MIDRTHDLPVVRQCQILRLARTTAYYTPQPTSDSDLQLMRRIDELHLEYPFAGSRMPRDMLRREGLQIGRKHVRTLMKQMGSRRCIANRTRASAMPPTRSIPICSEISRLIDRTGSGRRTSPTSRCAGASSIWWPCSTGIRGASCPGASPIR